MAKPEKRWQLLLVADDGRIIPLKRIKGVAVMLMILLVVLGLVCAGLAWQLTAEKVRHHRTLNRLAEADRLVAHYKGEHELIAAELVLAEARMERAGLLIPKPPQRTPPPAPSETADDQPVLEASKGAGEKDPLPAASVEAAVAEQPSIPATEKPAVKVARQIATDSAPAEATPDPEQPVVDLGDLEVQYDAGKRTLLARFRVKNNGPRSSPVAGRCVVVLKNDSMDSAAWLAMPGVKLMNGKPGGDQGQAFRISRFMDMEIKTMAPADPSVFKTATVYVFDSSGARIVGKDFAIALPAARPTARPAGEPSATGAGSLPGPSPSGNRPVIPQTSFESSGEATGILPPAHPPDGDSGGAPQPLPDKAPADDPSLTEGVEAKKKDDTRAPF